MLIEVQLVEPTTPGLPDPPELMKNPWQFVVPAPPTILVVAVIVVALTVRVELMSTP